MKKTLYSRRHETNLPAQEAQARKDARLSCPLKEPHRQEHAEAPPPQGPRAPLHLMPKRSRLTGAELRRLTGARRIHGAFFSVATSPAQGRAKVTVTVSKKVSPKAVERNLIKRRAKAALSPLLQHFPAGAYIFTARPVAREASFAALRTDIQSLARKIG